jgi:hypothetical protein
MWGHRRLKWEAIERRITAMTDYQKSFTSRKFNVMDIILFDEDLKPVDKLVAYVIIQHMNHANARSWPSEQRIARLVGGVHVKTVRRSIKRLVKFGIFSVTPRAGTSHLYGWTGDRSEHFQTVREELIAFRTKDTETPDTGVQTPRTSVSTPPDTDVPTPRTRVSP